MTHEFETGLGNHASNDVALTVQNAVRVYAQWLAATGATARRAAIEAACRAYGRVQYGRSFTDEDLREATDYVIRAWSETDGI